LHGFKLTPKVWRIRRGDFQAFVTAAERQAAHGEKERSELAERAERS
jgi:hypothetical protein